MIPIIARPYADVTSDLGPLISGRHQVCGGALQHVGHAIEERRR
jgi:hypothetical protein